MVGFDTGIVNNDDLFADFLLVDFKHRGEFDIATSLLNARHEHLKSLGLSEYTTGIARRSTKGLDRLGVSYEILEETGKDKVFVKIKLP